MDALMMVLAAMERGAQENGDNCFADVSWMEVLWVDDTEDSPVGGRHCWVHLAVRELPERVDPEWMGGEAWAR